MLYTIAQFDALAQLVDTRRQLATYEHHLCQLRETDPAYPCQQELVHAGLDLWRAAWERCFRLGVGVDQLIGLSLEAGMARRRELTAAGYVDGCWPSYQEVVRDRH